MTKVNSGASSGGGGGGGGGGGPGKSKAGGSFSSTSQTNSPKKPCGKKKPPPKKPCGVQVLHIAETWPPEDDTPSAPKPKDPPKPTKSQQQILKELDEVQEQLDREFEDQAKIRNLKKKRDRLLDELLMYAQYEARDQGKLEISKPVKDRAFYVCNRLPAKLDEKKKAAEKEILKLRKELQGMLKEWMSLHNNHEKLKADCMAITDELDKLAKARDSARLNLENANRDVKEAEDTANNDKTEGFKLRFKEFFGRDSRTLLQKAKEAQAKAKAEFDAAKNAYDEKRKWARGVQKRTEEAKQKLDKQTEKIKDQIGKIEKEEAKSRRLINTFKVGEHPIEMVAHGNKRWWTNLDIRAANELDSAKTPSVEVDVDPSDAQEDVPDEIWRKYCTKSFTLPKALGRAAVKGAHPTIEVINTNEKVYGDGFQKDDVIQTAGGAKPKFKVYQAAQFDAIAVGPWPLAEIFRLLRILTSPFPFKRTYLVKATACGLDTSDPPYGSASQLLQDIIVYPADSFEIAIKTTPAFGKAYERTQKVASETDLSSGTSKDASGTEDTITNKRIGQKDDTRYASGAKQGQEVPDPPAFPAKWMPSSPVTITFKHNGYEDEFIANLKNVVETIIWLAREAGTVASKITNIVPSVGWKFFWSVDFLAGELSYYNQFREHTDYRVYLYKKVKLSITIVTAKVGVFGGIWIEALYLEFKIGAEIAIQGSIGVKAEFESTHPDAANDVNIGFGPTGGVGVTAEFSVVIGRGDWCKASGSITTGISAEAMFWVKHTDGFFIDLLLKFEGVKPKAIFHLVLVGHWEKEWEMVKGRELYHGQFFKTPKDGEVDFEAQNEAMDASRKEAIEDAAALEKKIAKKKGS